MNTGRQLYAQHCAICHGVTGRGDGPSAESLNPPPLNLQVHVPLHEDLAIYQFISKGIPGTAMPAWQNTFSAEEQWHLVNYLRTLGRG